MTLFHNAFNPTDGWLAEAVQTAAGETVTYTRGARHETVTATIGQTVFSSNLEGGARIEFGEADAIIKVGDLPFGVPEEGDRITRTMGGLPVVYELATPDTGDPSHRYDPDRAEVRMHLKRVS